MSKSKIIALTSVSLLLLSGCFENTTSDNKSISQFDNTTDISDSYKNQGINESTSFSKVNQFTSASPLQDAKGVIRPVNKILATGFNQNTGGSACIDTNSKPNALMGEPVDPEFTKDCPPEEDPPAPTKGSFKTEVSDEWNYKYDATIFWKTSYSWEPVYVTISSACDGKSDSTQKLDLEFETSLKVTEGWARNETTKVELGDAKLSGLEGSLSTNLGGHYRFSSGETKKVKRSYTVNATKCSQTKLVVYQLTAKSDIRIEYTTKNWIFPNWTEIYTYKSQTSMSQFQGVYCELKCKPAGCCTPSQPSAPVALTGPA